ncbi:putative zinc finger and scan domain-containing protein 18 [Lasiodiplodia theobromae]|uniref:Uncharacterized protein n=1 Tax=Lasiodiplodia theobromae TaxID=45133 RepID=A0A5N5D6U8_9PEZI|nr:putative zinc finger and scan domain-containing protein 18 [Lasiodiplodia theobromae]KAB2573496.1 hypothetical protein DBV05_g7811 [Lasiodiplodia theobromae]KAF4544423.1 putative zinc finger and scan domain-containing protein 18 [Lasiodiplodia theobromae]
MRFSTTAGLALALLLGTVAAAPIAVESDEFHLDYIYTQKKDAIKRADEPAGDIHLDYIYTQKKDQKRDEPIHLDYIYTQNKDQKRDEPLHPDYIYTQKKDQKRGNRLVDVIIAEGGPGN